MLNYATDIIRVWSEILFSEGLCRVEASHFVCNANRLTGFCMGKGGGWRGGREVGERGWVEGGQGGGGAFAGKCYRTDKNLFLFTCLYLFTSGKLEIDLT